MATKKTSNAEVAAATSESAMAHIERDTKKALDGQKRYQVILPEEEHKKYQEFCVNGVRYTIKLGEPVEVPETIYRLIQNSKTQKRMFKAMEDKLIKSMELHV